MTSPQDPSPAPEPGAVDVYPYGDPPAIIPRWAEALLRVPLFWKLLVANVALIALAGAAGFWALERVDAPLLPTLLGVGALTVAAAALANALVVRLALRPVDILTSTAWDVRQGDWRARAPESLLADRRVERLGRVLNDMLDTVSASQRRQRELARRVLEAEERERERIAHELYAGTAQTLAGVLVRLRILARQAEGPSPCGPMDEITAEVRQALEEIRAVARRLRPPELDELGVRAALEAHARRLTEGRDLRVDFQGTIPESCLSEDARLALFRIAQEALTNAVRHAGARIVRARFVRAADALVAEVEDDGRGFDLPDTLQQGAGFGLMGMEERASYAGGSLAVVSRPGTGTRLRLVLPWVTPPGDGEAETAPEPGLGSLMPAGVPT